jgi:DNA polymerase-3 subunit epsilon
MRPRTLLIVDVETTGIEFDANAPIEIGAILFDVLHRAVIHQVSGLLPSAAPNGAVACNRIPDSLLEEPVVGAVAHAIVGLIDSLYQHADAVVAHNVQFDQQWLQPLLGARDVPWLCTLRDFRWNRPGLRSAPSLVDLALAHGVPVWAAHRALTDCTYLAQVLASRDDLPELLLDAQTPQSLYQALVSFDHREQAKSAGFQWQSHMPKMWTRYLREDEAAALPFKVRRIDDVPMASADMASAGSEFVQAKWLDPHQVAVARLEGAKSSACTTEG